MKTLYLLCGMPFSGKTTLGKSLTQHIEEMKNTFELPQADEKTINYSLEQPIEEWIARHFDYLN